MQYFKYGQDEIEYLKKKDKRLATAIDRIGMIERRVNPDLFSSLVNSIVGQQISTKAQKTIWGRMQDDLIEITPERILTCGEERLQKFGISFRKAGYINAIADAVADGRLDLKALEQLPDEDVVKILSSYPGIGVWTAEMLMIFSMQRPDVFSYGDLAIRRGLMTLQGHKEMDRARFERYRKRYSPYCSVASLYLWAIAGGQG